MSGRVQGVIGVVWKDTEKAEQTPAKQGNTSSTPRPAVTETKRITSSFVSNWLGKYDGTTCLETFLARFDSCLKYMGWNEEDQQFNLSVSLEGAAGQILWDAETRSVVEETIRLLRNRFININQVKRFRAELRGSLVRVYSRMFFD